MSISSILSLGAIFLFVISLLKPPVDSADSKTLLALLVFPLAFLSRGAFRNKNAPQDNSALSRIGLLLFFLLILYTTANWFFLSFPYWGNRAYIFFWVCCLCFLIGTRSDAPSLSLSLVKKAVIISVTFASIVVILQYFGYIYSTIRGTIPPEVTGWIGHKNVYGFMVMVSLVWTVSSLMSCPSLKFQTIALFSSSIAIQAAGLFLANARGPLILCALGTLSVVVYSFFSHGERIPFRVRIAIYLITGSILLTMFLLWPDHQWIRYARLVVPLPENNPGARSAFYLAQWLMFREKPFFGYGLGNFIHINMDFWPAWLTNKTDGFLFARNGHSEYLHLLSEVGFMGFFLTMFFWVGALVMLFRAWRRQQSITSFATLVAVVLMMAHGIFSVSTRILPAAALVWFCIGFAWRNPFQQGWHFFPHHVKKYSKFFFWGMHIVVVLFFGQIVVGDYEYLRYRKFRENKRPKAIGHLKRALRLCPSHPDALNHTAYESFNAKEYSYAVECAEKLAEISPNLDPCHFIKAASFFRLDSLDSALYYIDRELQIRPNYGDAEVMKLKILAKSGYCSEFRTYRNKRFSSCKDIDKSIQSHSRANADSIYQDMLGPFLSKVSGKQNRKVFDFKRNQSLKRMYKRKKQCTEAYSLTCPMDSVGQSH